MSSTGEIEETDDWGAYRVDEAALRHGAGVEEKTTDASVAYSAFPAAVISRCVEGSLPDLQSD